MSKVNKIIEELIKETDLRAEEINQMVIDKREELKGLISEEGALFIITKELGVDIKEKPTKTEEEQFTKEIQELTEEIKEENKEFLDIVKTPEYLVMYNALKRVLQDTTIKIEIVNSENISTAIPGETKSEKGITVKKDSKGKTESVKLQNITLVDQSEKAYKFRNDDFEIEWFAKKGVKYNESTKELEVLGWWIDFVESKGEPIEFKKE